MNCWLREYVKNLASGGAMIESTEIDEIEICCATPSIFAVTAATYL